MTDPRICSRLTRSRKFRDWAPLALLLIVAAAVGFSNLDSHGMMNWDEAEYASLGRSIRNLEGYKISEKLNFIRPPWWPGSIAVVMLAAGDTSEQTAKITSVLYALAAVALVYCVTLRFHGPWPATVAGWSLVIYPEFAVRSVSLLSETAFMALISASLAAFYFAFRKGGAWFYWGWGLWAAALSTRYTALLFGPVLVLVFLYEAVHDRDRLIRTLRERAFWLSPLVAFLILAPWYIRQELTHGGMFVGIRYAASQIPTYSSEVMPWYFYFAAMPEGLTTPGMLLAVGGLIYGLYRRRSWAVYLAAFIALVVAWHTRYDYKEVRLVTSTLPSLAMAAGIGAGLWAEQLAGGRSPARAIRAWGPPALLLAVGTVISVGSVRKAWTQSETGGAAALAQAFAYIQTEIAPDAVLLAEKQPQVYWYSDRSVLRAPIPETEYREALRKTDWVVITSFVRNPRAYVQPIRERMESGEDFGPGGRVFRRDGHEVLVATSAWVLRQLQLAETPGK